MKTKNCRFRRERDRNPAPDKVTRDILFIEVTLKEPSKGRQGTVRMSGTGSQVGGITGTARQT